MTLILEELYVCRGNSVYKIGCRRFWDMKLPFRLASTILMLRLDSKLGLGTGSVKEAILNASEKASLLLFDSFEVYSKRTG